jgi:hypothetical protein
MKSSWSIAIASIGAAAALTLMSHRLASFITA